WSMPNRIGGSIDQKDSVLHGFTRSLLFVSSLVAWAIQNLADGTRTEQSQTQRGLSFVQKTHADCRSPVLAYSLKIEMERCRQIACLIQHVLYSRPMHAMREFLRILLQGYSPNSIQCFLASICSTSFIRSLLTVPCPRFVFPLTF